MIHSLAGELGLDVYMVSLSRMGLDDTSLSSLISELPERCIALMEDIDDAFHQGLTRDLDDEDSEDDFDWEEVAVPTNEPVVVEVDGQREGPSSSALPVERQNIEITLQARPKVDDAAKCVLHSIFPKALLNSLCGSVGREPQLSMLRGWLGLAVTRCTQYYLWPMRARGISG